MSDSFQLLERLTLIAPLGVRFWDVASGAYVGSGLRVRVYPDGDSRRATEARLNSSGTYVLHHAPGLSEFGMGVGSSEFTDALPPRRSFTVEVKDNERRFLPCAFEANLPFKGLFRWDAPSARAPLDPPDNLAVPLYPSPLRDAPQGMAVLRAELYEASADETDDDSGRKPAAWAVLEALDDGRLLGRGIADEGGRIVLVFAYPAPRDSNSHSSGSPPEAFAAGLPFLKQEWTIELRAFYEPAELWSPSSPLAPSSGARGRLPLLNHLLHQQPADIFLDEARTEPLTEVTLMYGPKVFVRTSGANISSPLGHVPLSILFVTSAGSPP